VGIRMRGLDQISAHFTGTGVRIEPGSRNLGIFVSLDKLGEEYHLTHPSAHLGGFLKGSLQVTVSEQTYITCKQTGLRTILEYLDDGWFGKAKHRVRGIIYKIKDGEEKEYRKIDQVPPSSIIKRIDGTWRGVIRVTAADDKNFEKAEPIIYMQSLRTVGKLCRPIDTQYEYESRRVWEHVTNAIHEKQFSKATRLKHEVEEKQRRLADERKEKGLPWNPKFFVDPVHDGYPELTDRGQALVAEELLLAAKVSEEDECA